MPRISFIIPCFNTGHLLKQCFRSLMGQTFTDIEFIFVDDGSTDSTRTVIEDLIQSEPRAKLVTQANQGITEARLTGLKHASGEFVTFVDSDDFVDVTVAEEAIRLFDSSDNIDAVLYHMAHLKAGELRKFDYTMSFPITGHDVWKYTIPSWRISTMGFYRHAHALSAYTEIRLDTTNSNEVATRLIFNPCRQVAKTESFYYYVHNDDSISKKPSKRYITRLDSANWLREYSISHLSSHITRKDADIYYINSLCEIMLEYQVQKNSLDASTKSVWLDGLSKHRKNIIRIFWRAMIKYPFSILLDIKMIKKILYVLAWPAMIVNSRPWPSR